MDKNTGAGTNADITVTELAVEQIREFMVQQKIEADTAGLRVSAAPGGCSGIQYWLNIDAEPRIDDIVVVQDGLNIFLDAASAGFLKGAEIDFVSTAEATGFKVNNPNETGGCDCSCSEQCSP